MAQGRGSAVVATLFVLGVTLLLCCDIAHAGHGHHGHPGLHGQPGDLFVVGEKTGWTFRVEDWPQGKTFKPGDTLVFQYTPKTHNVVEVCQKSYDTCTVPPDGKVYATGDDRVILKPGWNYFICGIEGHCSMGMKIAINAV